LNHTNSFAQQKQVRAEFKSCIEIVDPQNKGMTILVPLVNSLYVPGHLSDAENMIVDVGTGYW
ncbi:hypothetical protein BDR05DRAFT_856087, partial [Suillus weaverae]